MAEQELILQDIGFQLDVPNGGELMTPEQVKRQGILEIIADSYNVPVGLRRSTKITTCLANGKWFQQIAQAYGFSYNTPPHRMGGSVEASVEWVRALETVGKWFVADNPDSRYQLLSHEVGTSIFRAMTIDVHSADWEEWTEHIRKK